MVRRSIGANQFDRFAPIHLARPALDGAKSLALKANFLSGFNLMWVVLSDA
jgi:hypothetical protein